MTDGMRSTARECKGIYKPTVWAILSWKRIAFFYFQASAKKEKTMEHKNWNGFKQGIWQDEINVRDFI